MKHSDRAKSMPRVNGCTFAPKLSEPTKPVTFRLLESQIQKLNLLPNKQDFVRDAIAKALKEYE